MKLNLVISSLLLGMTIAYHAAFADRPIYLEPNESRYVNGTQVFCESGGGGGRITRAFQCTVVNASYPSLDNSLTVRTDSHGNIQSDTLFQFHLQTTCNQVASRLSQRCSSGANCSVLFCEADNASYPSLDSTLYQVKSQHGGALTVSQVQKYRYQTECKQAAP